MSKKRKRSDNSKQLNLFNYLRGMRTQDKKTSEGTLNIGREIRQTLAEGIKQCSSSRHQIAGEMSHRIGVEITSTTIDSWTAESKERNRIPAEYIPAFCVVTGHFGLLDMLSEASGRFVLPGPDALRGEIQKWKEQLKKVNAEVKKRERLLEELERRRK